MSKKILDKRFVFTGEFSTDRDQLSNKVLIAGGRVTSAISGKTDYLVAGTEPGPSKMAKANSLGLKILTEDEFLGFFGPAKSKKGKVESPAEIKPEEILEIKAEPVEDKRLWTVKYEPQDLDQVLGNKSARDQLLNFISSPEKGRGILIHGPPGVGKSLSVKLACKKLGKQMIEFNASDLRSKGSLVEKISGFTNSISLTGKQRILVMDECDGMTGDRGGLAELGQIIRKSNVPVVCICNDRQVVRSLTSCCDEITFRKLETRQILACLRSIAAKESVQIPDAKIIETITLANNDLRFTLNSLQGAGKFKKVIATNIFDEGISIFRHKKINEKYESFFKDYDIIPLMVFENYLHCSSEIKPATKQTTSTEDYSPKIDQLACTNSKSQLLEHFKASDSISLSDLYSNISDWSLLPYSGYFSTILPTQNMRLHRRLEFPKELGFLSKKNKHTRILKEFKFHCLARLDFTEFYFYKFRSLVRKYMNYLIDGDTTSALELLCENNLLKGDMDEAIELLGETKSIATKNKSAMTRAYKKLKRSLPYSHEE